MATLTGLIERARLELGDSGRSFQTVATMDGETLRFDLAYAPVEPSTLRVFFQSSLTLLDPGAYTLDAGGGVLTLANRPDPGDTLVVQGTAYRYFTDAEWQVFCGTAFKKHTNNTGLTFERLPGVEEHLVSILGTIEALWALATDASKDIDISTPEGVSVPRSQRFRQLMQMIEALQDRYKELAQALNVGLSRIEMLNLRRVSRTTGRYVAQYIDREIEDTTPPVRLFPPIDRGVAGPARDSVPDRELVLVQGEPYLLALALGDITGYQRVTVQLRRYRASAAYRHFRITVDDAQIGQVSAVLTDRDTRAIGGGPYWWDVRVTDADGVTRTLEEGPVQIESRSRVP